MTDKKERIRPKPMNECGFKPNLMTTLEKIDSTRNALAVESKLRVATVNEIASGNAKQISFETISTIIKTLDVIATKNHKPEKHKVTDIFEYVEE